MLLGTDTAHRGPVGALPPVLTAVPPLPAAVTADAATCVCGHRQEAHEHYRPGSDCALCDCPRFRRQR